MGKDNQEFINLKSQFATSSEAQATDRLFERREEMKTARLRIALRSQMADAHNLDAAIRKEFGFGKG